MSDEQGEQPLASWPQRLRRGALFVLFALVLLIPKALDLRRRPRMWNALGFAAAAIGAFFFADKAGSLGSHLFGLLLILSALLARPAKRGKSVDDHARELGAVVVVNGGRFQTATGHPDTSGRVRACRLFVASERLHVLDLQHRPLLEIPFDAVSSVRAEEAAGSWRLLVERHKGIAEFHYDGFFAEHLARVAETTLRSQLRRELPVMK